MNSIPEVLRRRFRRIVVCPNVTNKAHHARNGSSYALRESLVFSCLLHFVVLFKGISLCVSQWLRPTRHVTHMQCRSSVRKCKKYVTSGSLSFFLFLWFSIFFVVCCTMPIEYIGEVMYARQLKTCSVGISVLFGCRRDVGRWMACVHVSFANLMSKTS